MLIDWVVSIVYLGLLLSWVPATWAISILQIGALLLGAAALIRQIDDSHSFHFSPDIIALALIVLWGPLQIALHLTVNSFETWNAALSWLALASVYLLARMLLHERADRQRFLTLQVWMGCGLALLSVIFNISSPHRIFAIFESRNVAWGPFIYKNHFAVFVELLLPVAFYKLTSDARQRTTFAVLFAALFACMVASLSRAGLVIAVAESVILIVLAWTRGKLPARSIRNFGLPLLLLIVLFTWTIGTDAIWTRFQEQNSYGVRAQLASSTMHMIQAKPLTGFGLGTWRSVYPQFATFDIARLANEAHNDWLQWASEGGLAFAAIILFLAAWVSRFAWKHVWGLGVPAVFVHCLIDYPTRSPGVAAFFFLFAGTLASVGLHEQLRSRKSSPEWKVVSVRTAAE